MNLLITNTHYGELRHDEQRMIDDLLWDGGLDYDTERAIQKLLDFHNSFTEGGLSAEDIVELVNTFSTADDVDYIVKTIKDWGATNRDELTPRQFSDSMLNWFNMDKEALKEECRYHGLRVSGTKSDMIERLRDHTLNIYDIVSD